MSNKLLLTLFSKNKVNFIIPSTTWILFILQMYFLTKEVFKFTI